MRDRTWLAILWESERENGSVVRFRRLKNESRVGLLFWAKTTRTVKAVFFVLCKEEMVMKDVVHVYSALSTLNHSTASTRFYARLVSPWINHSDRHSIAKLQMMVLKVVRTLVEQIIFNLIGKRTRRPQDETYRRTLPRSYNKSLFPWSKKRSLWVCRIYIYHKLPHPHVM